MKTGRRAALGVAVGTAASALAIRRWLHNWGSTPEEQESTYTGDEFITDPVSTSTLAVTVDAPFDRVWQWLVQIGQDRGGWYTFEALENLFGLDIHNTDEIREEWQHLEVGDQIWAVRPGSMGLEDGYAFRVARIEPGRALVLRQSPPEHPWNATWAFILVPIEQGRCRLLSRSRAASRPGADGLAARIAGAVMDPVVLFMTRGMLLGLKRRAEGLGSEISLA